MNWRSRDEKILATVEQFGCVGASHIARMFFSTHKYSEDKARKRLRSLTARNAIQCSKGLSNTYYIGNAIKQSRHNLARLEAYLKLMEQKQHYEDIKVYFEVPICQARADLFVSIHNKFTNSKSYTIIEIDLATNPFDKVELYNNIFDGDEWTKLWWAKGEVARFPRIIVYTTRPDVVKECFTTQNRNNLRWEVWPCEK
jgi:hypothetical protein